MNTNVAALMSAFHTAYIICLTLTIVFLVTTIALFFVLRIRDVIIELSGRARKQAIEEMSADQEIQDGKRIGIGLSGGIGSGRTTSGGIGKKQWSRGNSGMMLTDRIQVIQDSPATMPQGPSAENPQQLHAETFKRSAVVQSAPNLSNEFTVIQDVVVIHTQETI